MDHDQKCFDLAETFLERTPHLATGTRTYQLATLIQQTIDDFVATEQSNYEPPDSGAAWTGGFADNH
jgi:hypothetical protein